jgi:nicotinamidase-related amidase
LKTTAGRTLIDPDTLQIYQAYHRKTYVGDNPAVLAIDLYNKPIWRSRPVKEVDKEFSGCLRRARKAMPPTQRLLRAARRGGVPVIYSTRHVDTGGVQSTNRNLKELGKDIYDIKAELAPAPGELVITRSAPQFFGTPLIAHIAYDRRSTA